MKPVTRAWLRFGLLGGLLFALDLAVGEAPEAAAPSITKGPQSDEDLLLERALARGDHRRDAVVRRRLAQNMRFALDDADADEDALVEQAIGLGMHRTDLVARRRLAQIISLEIQGAARLPEPGEEELRAYWRAHAERWTEPPRVRLVQIPFEDEADASAALAGLPPAPDPRAARGIALPLPRELPPHSEPELAGLFGPGFASAVMPLPAGRWSGPVASAYAAHLVFVQERLAARQTPFETVRGQVREALLAERAQRALRETLARWRAEAEGGAS